MKQPDQIADEIIAEMQDYGLTKLQMLEVIKLAKEKFKEKKKCKNDCKIVPYIGTLEKCETCNRIFD